MAQKNEKEFLQTKARKLIAQNQNRFLLEHEKKRSEELEATLLFVHKENVWSVA
jgi:23S rRNA maturation-related 3'-5' exoribonuclease YhaM